VKGLDRRGLNEIERLALRNAFGDVEQHHIAKLLQTGEMCERTADLASTDQRNFWTRHGGNALGISRRGGRTGRTVAALRHSPIRACRSSRSGMSMTAAEFETFVVMKPRSGPGWSNSRASKAE